MEAGDAVSDLAVTETGRAADIERWLAEGTPEAASRLDELARVTASKDVRKAARRALYLLSQRGVAPAAASHAPRTAETLAAPVETMRAWASAFDGAGNRLFLLVLAGADGADATVAQILANDELGLRDLTIERRRLREIGPLMERLEARIDDGLAVAEIEPDYARAQLERFRETNRSRSTRTPAGFIDFAPRIGTTAERFDTPPVYAQLGAEQPADIPRDPVDLFKHPWFEPWFFAVEDVMPWLEAWMDAETGLVATSAKVRQERRSAIAREAAAALITERLRELYTTRLEESADVLRRRGRDREARQALVHAQALKAGGPVEDVPFAEAIAARTLEAAAEIVNQSRAEQARKTESGA
jgi:hypothetical protein